MQRDNDQPSALAHIRVLELGGPAGAHCGKLLADLGADVIKIEPPDGDPGRRIGPFAGDRPDPERSLSFINFNSNKRSVALDLDAEEDRAAFKRLAATADVVVESFRPGYLDSLGLGYDALSAEHPDLIMTSITSFGQHGLYSRFLGGDLVANAMAGLLSLQGDPDMPPCNAPLDQGYQLACIHGALATLYVLYQRATTERGDHIDISVQEVVGHMNYAIVRYDANDDIAQRPGREGVNPMVNAFPVKDGWVHLFPNRWDRILEVLDIPALREPQWNDRQYRLDHVAELDALVQAQTLTMTKRELTERGQGLGVPTGPVSTTEDFVTSPHIQARGFLVEQDHPVLGTIKYPGAPYSLTETPWRLRRPTPRHGEHTVEVLSEAASVPVRVRDRGVTAVAPERALPFKGLRVVEIATAYAGPFATRYLAELGAEVIKIESSLFGGQMETTVVRQPFPGGRTAQMMEINRSKRSVTLDLHRPEAQELTRRLAAISDICLNNYRPHTLNRWNVGYNDLKAVRPDIIMVEMPGFGYVGPHATYISYGQTLTAYSGIMRLWGHPESQEDRRCKLAYPDWIGAGKAALAITAALNYRQRTGKGQFIELAQVEGAAAMAGVAILDYVVNGRTAEPAGNRHVTFAPHNVYPCRGADRWVAIAITEDRQWMALCTAIGADDLAGDEGLATAAGRKAREAELDQRIGTWTRQYTPHQAMRLLQRAGVPAGAVQNGEDLYHDPHLRERGYTVLVDQPFIGPVAQPGLTMHFKHTSQEPPRPAPMQGEANDYVFGELLGMSRAEQRRLTEAGIMV